MYKEGEAKSKDNTPATTYSGRRKTTLVASVHLAHEQPLSSDLRSEQSSKSSSAELASESVFGSSLLVKRFNSSSASCKKTPPLSPLARPFPPGQ